MKIEAKTRLSASTRTPLIAKVGRPLNSQASGSYVCALPDTESKIKLARISAALGHPLGKDDVEDLHSTIMYAKGAFPESIPLQKGKRFGAKIIGIEFWDGHDNDGYVVAILDSPDLVNRNKEWAATGLKHSFDDYSPHVTLFDKLSKTDELVQKINAVAKKAIGTTLVFDQEQLEGLKIKD